MFIEQDSQNWVSLWRPLEKHSYAVSVETIEAILGE